MLLWNIPLDTRQGLPSASLDTVKQTWGFQDTGKIDPKALRAVIADNQNGENSNIRRVFGYTTLFQPKRAVTRAEAAAALWYFGTESDGITAKEALKLKQKQVIENLNCNYLTAEWVALQKFYATPVIYAQNLNI